MSHRIGDLESYESLQAFVAGIEHFRKLFDIDPEIVARDLHPDYLSTKYAHELKGVELIPMQHQHAHVASCLADNGYRGPAIGIAFDGFGHGADGTLWGGEFMVSDLAGFERAAIFKPVRMPGGAVAIKEPWRMAAAYPEPIYGDSLPAGLAVVQRNRRNWEAILPIARTRLNSPATSSVGRLFDAAACFSTNCRCRAR